MKSIIMRSTGFWVSNDSQDVINNAFFSNTLGLDTTDKWILKNTGILERRRSRITTSKMGTLAARMCLENAGVDPKKVDVIILSTVTPDMIFPASANIIQQNLGNKKAFSHDLNAGCSGWIYALAEATALLKTTNYEYALVIASERMTTMMDYQDRNTCILFGDAAACVLLQSIDTKKNPKHFGIQNFYLKSDGSGAQYLYQPAGGSNRPASHETVQSREHFLKINGPIVMKWAVPKMVDSVREVLRPFGLKPNDVDMIIPHQANSRISIQIERRLRVDKGKIQENIALFGNTSSASISLLLAQLDAGKDLTSGKKIVLVTFGTGFTWGACYLVWGETLDS